MPVSARSKLWSKGHTTILIKLKKLLNLNRDYVEMESTKMIGLLLRKLLLPAGDLHVLAEIAYN